MKRIFLLLSILLLSTSSTNKIYCDIKGNVKNPGVYEIKENYTIQDIINDAGGLKKNSYTENINLSKRVTDEMVIYIFNKNEIEKINKSFNCECETKYKYIECESDLTTEEQTTTSQTTTTQITTTQITSTESTLTQEKININLCTKEELLTIKGLGEVKAQAIIDYRELNGLFTSIESIMKVSGIGTSTFEKIKDYITI